MDILKGIYNKKIEVKNAEVVEREKYKEIILFSERRNIASIYLPENFQKIVLIIPGANYNEKKKKAIFFQFEYLIKERIGLCIFNLENSALKKNDFEFFTYIKEKIGEIRGLIEFMERNFNLDRFGLIGISFGGILGFIIAAMEERIENSLFLVSGGNMESITWRSILRFYLIKDCKRNACKNMHKIYKKLILAGLYSEISNFPRKCFLYDPLTYTEKLKGKKILMINGLFDFVIPFYSPLEIKKRLKNVKILWYPGTHLTYKYFLPFFKRRILEFLKDGNLYRH